MNTKYPQPICFSAVMGFFFAAMAGLPAFVRSVDAQYFVPLSHYAMFSNGLLEFSTCPTMTVNGPVHANGDIYTGSSASLTFNGTVTTTGTISSPAWNDQGPNWNDTGTYNGTPPWVTNMHPLLLCWGTNDPHAFIEMPLAGEDPTSTIGQSRLYNWAQTVLLVSNTTVTMTIQDPVGYGVPDPSPILLISTNTPAALATNFPFLVTTNTFTDQRENKLVQVTQIDVGKYGQWIKTNSSVLSKFPFVPYPTILYVADNRTNTSSQMNGIRLTNGRTPPVNGGMGWSVATPNPLYVLGHYNCTNSSYLGTTNTTASMPCAFMSDALTILSPAWQDSKSSGSYTARDAVDTTINAAILTGNVPSTGSSSSQFSGGVHNLPRLLEDWNSPSTKILTLNTSLINLFNSVIATQQFVNPGTYFDPPIRKFSYDLNFRHLAKQPPGVPCVVMPSPVIMVQPQSQIVQPGSNMTLNVSAVGALPLIYQWALNGLPIAGATGTNLVISNFDLTKAGVYSVVVTNQYGSATATAVLRLSNSPVVQVDGADVGGGPVSRTNMTQITMSSSFGPDAEIYYTLDGSEPDFTAMPYSGAFTLTSSAVVRAIAYNFAYTDWAEAAAIYIQVWPIYPLSVSTPGGGSVSVSPAPYSGTNLYVSGTLVTLTATPSNGWSFVGWTGDSTATSNVTTIAMDQPRTVQAVFQEWTTYPLSVSTPGGGSVSVSPAPYSGSNLYVSGTLVTLTATPSNGWSFVGWTGDSTATSNVTTIVMDQPRTVQAVFGTSLTLFTNGSGQVLMIPPTGPYPFGSTVRLTALPSAGHYFFGWANAASGFGNPLQFTVTNATPGITALFGALKSNQVSLTVLLNGSGSVTINPARNVYTNGDTVALTAVPAATYDFTGWSGDTSGALNPLALTLNANRLLTANFASTTATNLPPVFQTIGRAADTLTFTWNAVPGQAYQVQYRTNLLQTNWSNLGSVAFATDDTMAASDLVASGSSQRFYRVVEQLTPAQVCIGNLRQIHAATQQWALEHNAPPYATVTAADIAPYLTGPLVCPSGGSAATFDNCYALNVWTNPTCKIVPFLHALPR